MTRAGFEPTNVIRQFFTFFPVFHAFPRSQNLYRYLIEDEEFFEPSFDDAGECGDILPVAISGSGPAGKIFSSNLNSTPMTSYQLPILLFA